MMEFATKAAKEMSVSTGSLQGEGAMQPQDTAAECQTVPQNSPTKQPPTPDSPSYPRTTGIRSFLDGYKQTW